MLQVETLKRLQLRRWRLVVLCLGAPFLLYIACGFLLVPRIIRSQIRSQASTRLHRSVRMDKVRFNPFTLVTIITGFELSDLDGMPLVGLDSFRADLQVSGLFRRALRFREIVFEHPVVSARILQAVSYTHLTLPTIYSV